MVEPGGDPSAEEFRRLEQAIKDLRQELELTHHQQAYLQMQVTALSNAKSGPRASASNAASFWRSVLIKIARRNPYLYKFATRVSRFLRR